MAESSFFFPETREKKLYGFIHACPESPSRGFLFVHPFAEEKNISHYITAQMSRTLQSRGFPVMRFDLSGTGDSCLELNEVTASQWLLDIDMAIREFKSLTGVKQIILWGLRLGANLALAASRGKDEVCGVFLWQPVHNIKRYLHQFIRQRISTDIAAGKKSQLTVKKLLKEMEEKGEIEVAGYPLTCDLYHSLIDLEASLTEFHPEIPLAAISIGPTGTAPATMGNFLNQLEGAPNEVRVKHVVEEPFWDRYWRWEAPATQRATVESVMDLTRREV